MKINLQHIAEQTIAQAQKLGADEADVIVHRSKSLSVNVMEGELENVQNHDQITLGLRVIVGKKQVCVGGSDFRKSAIAEITERAISMAKESPDDPHIGLADRKQVYKHNDAHKLNLYNEKGFPTSEQFTKMASTIEDSAREVTGVSKTRSTAAGYGESCFYFMATNDFACAINRNFMTASCAAIAGDGLEMEIDGYGESRIFPEDMSAPEYIGREAGERATAKLGSIKPKTMTCPVLFDRRVSSSLVGHILSAINGSAITRGSSWLKEDMDRQVLPSNLDLLEEPFRTKSLSSALFDDEGIPKQERKFIDQGKLKSWIMDLRTSRELGLETTGNATRGVTSPPSPGVSNIALTCGSKSPEELMEDVQFGVLITSLMGTTINRNTGDYSRGASGFLIENGAKTQPISEFTIAGNLKDMLQTIIPSNNPREFSSLRVPSLLIDNMTIAGS